jgi:hypothetical protein
VSSRHRLDGRGGSAGRSWSLHPLAKQYSASERDTGRRLVPHRPPDPSEPGSSRPGLVHRPANQPPRRARTAMLSRSAHP